jgi:DNA sulfur modification protein DndD
LDVLHSQLQQLKNRLDEVETGILELENKVEFTKGQIQKEEMLITREGGGYANKRHELKARKDVLDDKIQDFEDQIRGLMSELLPFAVALPSCVRLRNQILTEEAHLSEMMARKELEKKMLALRDVLTSESFWSGISDNEVSTSTRSKVLSRITRSIETLLSQLTPSNNKIIHEDLSTPDRQMLLQWIDVVLTKMPRVIKELSDSMEKLMLERQEIEKFLLRSPPEEVLHPFIQELNKLHAELGSLEQKLVHEVKHRSELKFKISELVSRLSKLYDNQDQRKDLSIKEQLAERAQQLLAEYLVKIRSEKLKALEENLVTALNHLSHKKMFQRARIDPNNFSVVLLDAQGDEIPKEQLSAGEKQIYAIAILWALARTSGRPLPFIIDTPLGRLDSEHRTNLVSDFFPFASHQVIIFSTDTEIDEKYFEELQSYVSRAYLLAHDNQRGRTNAIEGYFWKTKNQPIVSGRKGGRR